MVQELERKRQSAFFPESAPAANPVFFRTYSRRTDAGLRESYDQVCDSEALRRNRTLKGLVELGKLTPEDTAVINVTQSKLGKLEKSSLELFLDKQESRKQIQELNHKLRAKDTENKQLKENYLQLEQQYGQLKEKHQELQEDYLQLKWENRELQDKINEFDCFPNIYSLDGDANCNWIDD